MKDTRYNLNKTNFAMIPLRTLLLKLLLPHSKGKTFANLANLPLRTSRFNTSLLTNKTLWLVALLLNVMFSQAQ
jgi:hypothetical protein